MANNSFFVKRLLSYYLAVHILDSQNWCDYSSALIAQLLSICQDIVDPKIRTVD
jgi:hypothetical protein